MFDINATINQAIAQAVEARITDLKQTYANQMGELAHRISALDSDLNAARASMHAMAARINELEGKLTAQVPPEGLANADTPLVSRFVSELNDQEWFWNKVNAYINRNSESVSDIVKEEWQDWMKHVVDEKIEDKIERAIDNYDFEYKIERAIDDIDFEDKIKDALADADFDFDIDSKVSDAIDDIDFATKIKDVLDDARITIAL